MLKFDFAHTGWI